MLQTLMKDDIGQHQEFEAIDLIYSPEKYVDTGIDLKLLKEERVQESSSDKYETVKIWQQINANDSRNFYHVYQDWFSEYET